MMNDPDEDRRPSRQLSARWLVPSKRGPTPRLTAAELPLRGWDEATAAGLPSEQGIEVLRGERSLLEQVLDRGNATPATTGGAAPLRHRIQVGSATGDHVAQIRLADDLAVADDHRCLLARARPRMAGTGSLARDQG